jgi:CO/xanthine dehydrogenase Mo-binding subunit
MKRRAFLKTGGALIVAFTVPALQAEEAKTPPLPGSLKVEPYLDGWIRIDASGLVRVMTGKAELGQGIKTALLQLAATELVLPPERITMVTADTMQTANEGYTSGSHSMQDSGTAIRHAAAQTRVILLQRAAEHFGVAADALQIADGRISYGSASIAYGELVGDGLTHVQANPQSRFEGDGPTRMIGKSLPRIDLPGKVSGGMAYVQDLRLPGMVHARMVRPISPDARLNALDATAVEQMPGVLKVVRDGRFIGVLAEQEYQAITASKALRALAQWDDSAAALPAADEMYRVLRSSRQEVDVILDRGSVPDQSDKQLFATYLRPYQMHGSIGPSCAVALRDGDKTTVWTHTQGVFPLRKALAELLGRPESDVHCIHTEGSGCYGHNGADDVAADAALLAAALPGRPVRVQWMREDEHGWEPLAPPMIVDLRASLDETGKISSWQHEVWSGTHSTRPGKAGDLLAGVLIEKPFAPSVPKPIPQPEGGGDRNAIPLYSFANARVVHHFVLDMPRRISAMRSLGAYANVFAIESFMDELALAASADPVAFRLAHLDDPRGRAVIALAAEQFGWASRTARPGHGYGFAFARYKNLGAYLAMALEIELWRDSAQLRVKRVVAAVDSGEVVSPDGIRNQIEGGIVQAISWTNLEAVRFNQSSVAALDWAGYPILRFLDVPESVEVHIVDQPGQPFLGTGEASQGPTAAALANAIVDATGERCRELPFDRARLRKTFGVNAEKPLS